MSEELQNDAAPVEEVETQDALIENPQDGSDLAPEAETTEQTQVNEEEKKAKAQAAFNKEYGAKKQAERERDAIKAQFDELKQQSMQPPPNVGEMPNEYDYDTPEDFQQAKNSYVNAIQTKASYDAQQKAAADQQLVQQQATQQAAVQDLTEKAQTFLNNAKTVGVTDEEVNQYANTVINQYGMHDNLRVALLGHPEGPLMFKHLAGNPQELGLLNNMDPYSAGSYIENTLKAKAVALKPKTSDAPPPAQDIEGAGVDPENGKYKHLKGVKYS